MSTPPIHSLTTIDGVFAHLGRTALVTPDELAANSDVPVRVVGRNLRQLARSGLLTRVQAPGNDQFKVTLWASRRREPVREVLRQIPPSAWRGGADSDHQLAIAQALQMHPGELLVYADEGLLLTKLDLKGERDPYGRYLWTRGPDQPPVKVVSEGSLDRLKEVVELVAQSSGLKGVGESYHAKGSAALTPVFETRAWGHVRFRPVDANGSPLRSGELPPDEARPVEARRLAIGEQLRERLDAEFGSEWTVRVTFGITSIDIYPVGHDKSMGRDHLLSGGRLGQRRQLVSIADRVDGNDAPLIATALPRDGDRFMMLSVAASVEAAETWLSPARVAPGILTGHLGAGYQATLRFLHRLVHLGGKGLSPLQALGRALHEAQQTRLGADNSAAADVVLSTWDDELPVTLAFDIDETLNRGDGDAVPEVALAAMRALDPLGFQMAINTGKSLDRLRARDILAPFERVRIVDSLEGGQE